MSVSRTVSRRRCTEWASLPDRAATAATLRGTQSSASQHHSAALLRDVYMESITDVAARLTSRMQRTGANLALHHPCIED